MNKRGIIIKTTIYPSNKARQPNKRTTAAANTPHADVIHIARTSATKNENNNDSRTIKIMYNPYPI